MKELYLIRHGKTLANENHLYCGASDLPLSDRGTASLVPFSGRLPENCQFLTSGMNRTEQTLQLVFGNVPHDRDPRFREIDFGAFELHSYEQLKDRPDYQIWISGDGKTAPPGGESGEDFRARILEGLEDLLKSPVPVVLVTHGGVIAAIMEHLFPAEGKSRYQWQPQPGGGYHITQAGYTLWNPAERSTQP